METFFTSLLQTLPTVAKSPYALAAYSLAVVAYLILAWRIARHRELLQHLTKLPKEERLRALQTEMSEILPESVTFDQWMTLRKQRYIFWGCLIAGLTLVAVVSFGIYSLDRGKVSTQISLSDEDQQAFVELQQASRFFRLTRIAYDQQHSQDGLVTIQPTFDYRTALLDGKILPYLNPAQPITWSYPKLSVKSANNSKSTILLTRLQVKIEESLLDNEPIPIVMGAGEQGYFRIRNDGWQKINNASASIELYDYEVCPSHFGLFDMAGEMPNEPSVKPWAKFEFPVSEDEGKFGFDVRPYIPKPKLAELVKCPGYASEMCQSDGSCSGLDEKEVRCFDKRDPDLSTTEGQTCKDFDRKAAAAAVAKHWHDKLAGGRKSYYFRDECSAKPICAIGSVKYKVSAGAVRNFRFAVGISLNPPGGGAGRPSDWTYSMFLKAGASGKTYERPISQEIKPGDTDHFALQLATDRSASFRLRISLLDSEGKVVSSERVSLGMVIPRSHEEDITTKNIRCNLKLDYDGPLDCSPSRYRSKSHDATSDHISSASPRP